MHFKIYKNAYIYISNQPDTIVTVYPKYLWYLILDKYLGFICFNISVSKNYATLCVLFNFKFINKNLLLFIKSLCHDFVKLFYFF